VSPSLSREWSHSSTAAIAQWLAMGATLLPLSFLPPVDTHFLVSLDVTTPALMVAPAGSFVIPICNSHAPEAAHVPQPSSPCST
jgi:hypothetical protein